MDEKNTIEIMLPNNKTVLNFLKLKDKDKIKVLELGQSFLIDGNRQLQYWNNEQTETVITNIKKKSEKEIMELKHKLANKKKELFDMVENQKENNIILEKQIKNEINSVYNDKIIGFEEKIIKRDEELNEKRMELNKTRSEMYEIISKKIDEKEEIWLNRLDKQKIHYEDIIKKEREKQDKLFIREQNSTIKGIDGENFTLQELNVRFPSSEIEDTHKESNRGDFIIKTKNGLNIMIENKNYTRNVPKIEIDKFYTDIKTNADINGGVFVSLKSGICKKDDFQLEIIEGKPVIFLHNLLKNMDNIEKSVMIIKLICNKDCFDLNNKEILDTLTNFSPTLKRNMAKMKKSLKKHETDMLSCMINQEQIVKKIFNLFKIKY